MHEFVAPKLMRGTKHGEPISGRVRRFASAWRRGRSLAIFTAALASALLCAAPTHGVARPGKTKRPATYRYPGNLFSCRGPASWLVSEHVPAKDGMGPGVTFLEPDGRALISLRYFPRSGTYRGRRVVPPVYRSAREYYRQQILGRLAQESDSPKLDMLPVVDSPLIPVAWQGKKVFEFSLAYTEVLQSPELGTRSDRMRDDAVLIPMREGLFAVRYSVEEKEFPGDLDAFRTVLKTLTLKEAAQPAAPGTPEAPKLPPLTLIGFSAPQNTQTHKPPRATAVPRQAPRLIRQWHGQFAFEKTPHHLVVSSAAEWRQTWQMLRGEGPTPAVDFSKERVVVVFAGQVPTGGYFVEFGQPREEGKSLIAPYCVRAPRGIATQVLSQPWGAAVVAGAGLNVTAEEDCGPTADVKQEQGAIAGRVTDQENTPVPLVRVTAEGGPRGGKFSTETGHNGDYRLNGLEPGFYQVTFINVGFQVVVFRKVKVLPGKTVTLNVQLKVAP